MNKKVNSDSLIHILTGGGLINKYCYFLIMVTLIGGHIFVAFNMEDIRDTILLLTYHMLALIICLLIGASIFIYKKFKASENDNKESRINFIKPYLIDYAKACIYAFVIFVIISITVNSPIQFREDLRDDFSNAGITFIYFIATVIFSFRLK